MDIKKQLSVAGEGAKLVAKQAERMKVANVSLPGAYRKLGEEVFKAGTLQDKLGDGFAKIRSSIEEQEKLNQTGPAAEGFGQKMKAAAISAKNMAVSKKMEFDRGGMFSELGRLAFEGHKEQLNDSFSLSPIENELAKLAALDAEISELGSSGQGSFFNPRNVALGFVAVAGLAVAFIGYRMVFGGLLNRYSQSEGREILSELNSYQLAFKDLDNKDEEIKRIEKQEKKLMTQAGIAYLSEDVEKQYPEIKKLADEIKKKKSENNEKRDEIMEGFYKTYVKASDLVLNKLDSLSKTEAEEIYGKLIDMAVQNGSPGMVQRAKEIAREAFRNSVTPRCDKTLATQWLGEVHSTLSILEEAKTNSEGSSNKNNKNNLDNRLTNIDSKTAPKDSENLNKIEDFKVKDFKATTSKNFSISMPKESIPPPKR